jgi:hypothetical protein
MPRHDISCDAVQLWPWGMPVPTPDFAQIVLSSTQALIGDLQALARHLTAGHSAIRRCTPLVT